MKHKILIVDNLEEMHERGKTVLNRVSFQIFTASTGHEALSLHKAHQVDLMVISLDLPDMGGDKLCSLIRKDPDLRQVSIIMTCSNNPDCVARATHCGANAHITKPFHSGQLTEQVTKFLAIPLRQGCRVLISISIKGSLDHEPFFCSSHDISSTGIMIETDKRLEKGNLLSCSFFLPGVGKIVTDAEVMRTDHSADTLRYGVRFRYLDPEYKNGIDTFIANRTEQLA
ncbi:MAG: response regulator [Nitrospirae bacterium]|nr:response regulator [Nitrospirota bacterium]